MLGETCLGIILRGEHGELVFMALRTYVFKKAFEPRRWGWQLCDPGYTPRRVRADNVESAPHAHHLQNPQNRPWYRFCNRLADRPLGGMGESGTSRMEAEWPTPSRSRADRGGGADNSCSPPRQLVSSLNGPSLTITGAVTGFEGFEGAGHSIAVMPAPWIDRIGSRRTPSSFQRRRA